jgi:hypothetical protein
MALSSKAFSSEVGTGSREENAANLQPLAGIGVADRGHEEAEAKRQHDNVQHELLLCVANADRIDGLAFMHW